MFIGDARMIYCAAGPYFTDQWGRRWEIDLTSFRTADIGASLRKLGRDEPVEFARLLLTPTMLGEITLILARGPDGEIGSLDGSLRGWLANPSELEYAALQLAPALAEAVAASDEADDRLQFGIAKAICFVTGDAEADALLPNDRGL